MSTPWSSSRAASVCLLALAASCATYQDRTEEALGDFRAGRFASAEAQFGDPGTTGSGFLAGAEAGTSALTDGRWEEAVLWFERAGRIIEELEAEGLLDPGSLAQGMGGLFLSEELSEYRGEGYERVMLHALWGLAYLGQGALEDTLVEVRRSNRLLAAEGTFYDKEYKGAGLAHFLSAIGHELRSEDDEAWIDWRALEAKGLAPSVHEPALQRCAARLSRTEELERLVARDGEAPELPPGAARIVLIAGVGQGPVKVEKRQDILTPDGSISIALPHYQRQPQPVQHLEMTVSGVAVRSAELEAVHALAQESLADRIAWMAARNLVRTVAKQQLRKALADQARSDGGDGAAAAVGLLGDILSIATERADLRCWSTLPDSWQVAITHAAPGVHPLALSIPGGVTADLGTLRLEAGETVFVLARTLGRDLHARRVGGLEVASAAATVP